MPEHLRVALSPRVQTQSAPQPKAIEPATIEVQLPNEVAQDQVAPALTLSPDVPPSTTPVLGRGVRAGPAAAVRSPPSHTPRRLEHQEQPVPQGTSDVQPAQDLLPNPYKE
jgi:hypothetical protein